MKSEPGSPAHKHLSFGQPSWRLASSDVEAFVTELGGHLGPITFERRGRKLRPYSVAPWAQEPVDASLPPILRVLRGDFFCLPFGGNGTPFRGERHPVHGETANRRWRFEGLEMTRDRTCLHLSLRTRLRPGRVDKWVSQLPGQNVVYCRHKISGMRGPMNLGHHAMLKFPDQPGCGVLSTSRFVYGQVFPQPVELPENRGYSFLKPGAEFKSLEKVPTITGETTDLTRYPARRGFEDLVMLVTDAKAPFAWTAVTFPQERYVWFALKDPRILPQTVFWLSNGGRHYPPWNGRHVNVLGLEEVCSYFHPGLAQSANRNPISAKGHPTCHRLDPKRPLTVNYLMGVARIPQGFDRVASVQRLTGGHALRLQSAAGPTVEARVDWSFLRA